MSMIKKIFLNLGLATVLLCLTASVSAFLLALNRVTNVRDRPVTVNIQRYMGGAWHEQFKFTVKANSELILPWATVWLGDTVSDGSDGSGYINIQDPALPATVYYTWELNNGFNVNYGDQKVFTAGIYPLQGKAWVHLLIDNGGWPSSVLAAGG